MAAPGTITHVIEVAQHLAATVTAHQVAVAAQAAAAAVSVPSAAAAPTDRPAG